MGPLAVTFIPDETISNGTAGFLALAPGSPAYEEHGEMVLDVSMWQYQTGNHLVLVKVHPSHQSKDKTRKFKPL